MTVTVKGTNPARKSVRSWKHKGSSSELWRAIGKTGCANADTSIAVAIFYIQSLVSAIDEGCSAAANMQPAPPLTSQCVEHEKRDVKH